VGKFLLTEMAHKHSAVFSMEELEEVIRIGDDFYEAEQDVNDGDDEDKSDSTMYASLLLRQWRNMLLHC